MEKKTKKEQIKKVYDEMENKDTYITEEELKYLVKAAEDILEYIKNPRQLKPCPTLTIGVLNEIDLCRRLDMTIASIVHEIKYI